jgi:hypothetical protein
VSDVSDKLERGGMCGLRICGEDSEGLECESTLEADLLDALNESCPVTNVELAAGEIGVGDHMHIVLSVVIVDVEDGESMTESLDIFIV